MSFTLSLVELPCVTAYHFLLSLYTKVQRFHRWKSWMKLTQWRKMKSLKDFKQGGFPLLEVIKYKVPCSNFNIIFTLFRHHRLPHPSVHPPNILIQQNREPKTSQLYTKIFCYSWLCEKGSLWRHFQTRGANPTFLPCATSYHLAALLSLFNLQCLPQVDDHHETVITYITHGKQSFLQRKSV